MHPTKKCISVLGLGKGPRICISNKFPDDADARPYYENHWYRKKELLHRNRFGSNMQKFPGMPATFYFLMSVVITRCNH